MLKDSSFAKVLGLLAPQLRPRALELVLVSGLAAITAAAEKAPLLFLGPLVDRVLFPGSESGLSSVGFVQRSFDVVTRGVQSALGTNLETDTQLRLGQLAAVLAIIIGCAVVGAIAEYQFVWLSRRTGLKMVLGLRNRLASHLMRLPLAYHGRRSFGDLLSRISSDVNSTLAMIQAALRDLTQQPLQIAASLIGAWWISPKLTLGVILVLPLIALPIAIMGKRVRRRSRASLNTLGASVEVLTQMLRGVRTVKAYRAEEREIQRYQAINQGYLRASMKMVRAVATIEAATTLMSAVGFALLLGGAGWLVVTKGSFQSNGEMLTFIGLVASTYRNVKALSNTTSRVQESAGAAERLQAVLDEVYVEHQAPEAKAISSLGQGLEFHDVSFRYPGGERPALEKIDLVLRPGETVALVGRSGSGKSTLVDLVARFIQPSSGRITVDGMDLRQCSLDSWNALYAMVTQEPFLFHTTIDENIRYGRPGATREQVEAAAKAANIHDFILSLPEGYETQVGDAGSRLSGGQRQRITIARALLKDAPLLLLDEATSALDSESEAVVQDALEKLMKDRMVLVIAHRLSTVRNADRIAVLERGRVVELGSHEQLLAKGGAYAGFHAAQFTSASSSTGPTSPEKTENSKLGPRASPTAG